MLRQKIQEYRKRLRSAARRLAGGGVLGEAFVAIAPPAPAPDRAGLCLVAVIKDEEAYLAEWIAFHRLLGAQGFVFYDNGSTDGTRALLAPLEAAGVARVVDWRVFCDLARPQALAHAHAVVNYGAAWRWMAFIDVDEFLFPAEGADLLDALDALAHLPSVSLPWRNFGPGGHVDRPAGLVIEHYRERAVFPPLPGQSSLLRHKTIVDPARVTGLGTHMHAVDGGPPGSFTEAGRRITPETARDPALLCDGALRLNHYFTRSKAEMAAKIAKGRISRQGAVDPRALDNRLAAYALGTETDEAILRFVRPLKAAMAVGMERSDP